jgi:hypothetical protein
MELNHICKVYGVHVNKTWETEVRFSLLIPLLAVALSFAQNPAKSIHCKNQASSYFV